MFEQLARFARSLGTSSRILGGIEPERWLSESQRDDKLDAMGTRLSISVVKSSVMEREERLIESIVPSEFVVWLRVSIFIGVDDVESAKREIKAVRGLVVLIKNRVANGCSDRMWRAVAKSPKYVVLCENRRRGKRSVRLSYCVS